MSEIKAAKLVEIGKKASTIVLPQAL